MRFSYWYVNVSILQMQGSCKVPWLKKNLYSANGIEFETLTYYKFVQWLYIQNRTMALYFLGDNEKGAVKALTSST
jgi:hypothetical protein